MSQLTESKLKQLIKQVYLDALKDLTEEEPALLAEPQFEGHEPPDLTESKQSGMSRLITILNKLDDDDRDRLFRRYGYYTTAHLLQQLNNIKKAEKGDL